MFRSIIDIMVNENSKAKRIGLKILKWLIIWLIIPVLIDVFNMFVLNSFLPMLWLMFDWYLPAFWGSMLAWVVYGAVVTGIKKIVNNNIEE